MEISTDVKWEIFPHQIYRLHRIVIDWKGASALKNLEWGNNNAFSNIYFDGSVVIQEPKIEFFDAPIPKSSVFKRFKTTLISIIKKTRKTDKKRDLDVIVEESRLNTIIKINLDEFNDEFHLFKNDNFTTVITFKESRPTQLVRSRTSENLNFQPHLFSKSYHVNFYLPKIHFLKRIIHSVFNIGSNTNNDVVWFPIEYEPEIKSDKLVFLMTEENMGHDLQIWYTFQDINLFKLLLRTAAFLFIAFFQTVVQFILSIWSTKP